MKNKLFKESFKETTARYLQELQQGYRIDVKTGQCVSLTQKEIAYRSGFLQSQKMSADDRAFLSGVSEGKKAHRRSIRNAKYYNRGKGRSANPLMIPDDIIYL